MARPASELSLEIAASRDEGEQAANVRDAPRERPMPRSQRRRRIEQHGIARPQRRSHRSDDVDVIPSTLCRDLRKRLRQLARIHASARAHKLFESLGDVTGSRCRHGPQPLLLCSTAPCSPRASSVF